MMRASGLVAFALLAAGAAPALAGEQPMDLRPPGAAEVAPAPVKKHVVKVEPPLPRLRPSAEVASAAPVGAEPAPADEPAVDRSLQTGAIAAPEPPAAASPAPIAVAAQPEPATPVHPAVAAAAEPLLGDGLPGDPEAVPGAPMDSGAGATPSAVGEGDTTPPYQMVRTLQMLQDQIAQGSTRALAAQRALRGRIDATFAAAPASTWQDGRNAAAAVTYVLSGGSPAILEHLVALDPKPAVDQRLLGGALAYITGREALANELLGPLNPLDLPISMAGQVALAQSALMVRTDPAKAMALLDTARLLGTGTLVEEAALRREIFVADQLKRYDKVEALARQYLDRFRHSVYAGNFRNRFAAAVTHMDFVKGAEQFKRLDDMVASVEPPARCQIYLTVALASVVRGNGLAARLAAERAAALADNGSPEESRAALYRAAGGVADAKTFDDAAKALAAVRTDQLSASDQALLTMVQTTLDGVGSGTKVIVKSERQLAWLAGEKDNSATPIMKRANEALKVADAALAAAPK